MAFCKTKHMQACDVGWNLWAHMARHNVRHQAV